MNVVADVFLVAGAIFALIAGIGVYRFDDVFARMHAASKGPTLALLLVAVGASLEFGTLAAVVTFTLVIVLQLLTAPVGAHLVGRAAHRRVARRVDAFDALDDAETARRAAESARRAEGPEG